MLEAAQNLEFERAAQLRDKLNEMKGAPTIKSGAAFTPDPEAGPAEDLAAQDQHPAGASGGRRSRPRKQIPSSL